VTAKAGGHPEEGGEFDIDFSFKGPSAFPRALRAWIGNEEADQTGKTRIDASGHGHLPVPDKIESEDCLWIEVEDESGKKRASLPIPGHDSHSGHGHGHGESDVITAEVRALESGGFELTLKTDEGKIVGANDVKTVHEHPVHLIAVDASLIDFQHVHPTSTEANTWTFNFTPAKPGDYRLYSEVTLHDSEAASRGFTILSNPGEAEPIDPTLSSTVLKGGIRFDLSWDPEPVTDHHGRFTVTLAQPDGSGPALENFMGATAHVVSLGEDPSTFGHIHPSTKQGDASGTRTTIRGEVEHHAAGFHRLYVHVKIGGEELVASFGYLVSSDSHDHDHDKGHH
jgi:hypothetical protein